MSIRYYDEAITAKLKKWIPENSHLRVLMPEETKKLIELTADDNNDQKLKLPIISLSRNNDIQILSNIKQPRSFDGLKISGNEEATVELNILPIKLEYSLDIWTKTFEDGDEYLRNFLFKLINNPSYRITIPYNGADIEHIFNIRVLDSVADTSSISERIFSGQFHRWTIQFEIQDAFFFSIPYRNNWKLEGVDFEVYNTKLTEEKPLETYSINFNSN